MGTPDFGEKALRDMVAEGYHIVGVFTQKDKPRDRMKVEPCPIKKVATALGLATFAFDKVKSAEGVQAIKDLRPDLIVTAAFGQLISQEILDIPKYGVFNIHASLLPKFRGGCPIQWAIVLGEQETGVTIMRTVLRLDAGDMIVSQSTSIQPSDTYASLYNRLSEIGATLLLQVLQMPQLSFVPQDEKAASYQPILQKKDARIDFSKTARQIDCLVRGTNPMPIAFCFLGDQVLKVYEVQVLQRETLPSSGVGEATKASKVGQVIVSHPKEGLIVKCGQDFVKLLQVQLPSKKRMQMSDFLAGNKIPVGTVLG